MRTAWAGWCRALFKQFGTNFVNNFAEQLTRHLTRPVQLVGGLYLVAAPKQTVGADQGRGCQNCSELQSHA